MAGYWPSSFFAGLWTETESRSISTQKKERDQYPAILTEQAWSIKDLLYGYWGNFSCETRRDKAGSLTRHFLPSGQSFKFGSFGDGNGELNYPCYVAVNSQGHIIVSDMHSHRIQVCCPVYHCVYRAAFN